MNIFVFNNGSSSLKACLYRIKAYPLEPVSPLWEARLEWKNDFKNASLKIKKEGSPWSEEICRSRSLKGSFPLLLHHLHKGKHAVLKAIDEIAIAGHRIVHGGIEYRESVLIDASVKKRIRQLAKLAPLHNAADLEGIDALDRLCKQMPQIAVFDTAFHHTLALKNTIYPTPYSWFEQGIRRFGFHGISFQYCTSRAMQLLPFKPSKMVICHLGSGASLCAVENGKSIDTTMGFTPLEGLMMDTRSGSIDPGILLYLLEKKKKTITSLSQDLYHRSGLLGVSGISSDLRDIQSAEAKGNERAKLALDIYLHKLTGAIGSMIASLQGIDTLVFTAGIGENAPLIRQEACKAFAFLGLTLDPEQNSIRSSADKLISTARSTVAVLLIHSQEALEIARECWKKANL